MYLDEAAVHEVLERLRQAEPLGASPLRNLLCIQRQIGCSKGVFKAQVEDVIWQTLVQIIEEQVGYLRGLEELAPPTANTRTAFLGALRADFSRANSELEAWSTLYHRYVRIDLNLQVQTIAQALNTSARQVQRRLALGYRRLAQELNRREQQVCARHRRLRLHLKLPPASYSTLFGREEILEALHNSLRGRNPIHTTLLIGSGGIGKTTLAHAAVKRLIETDYFADVLWLTLDQPTNRKALLAAVAHDAGYVDFGDIDLQKLETCLRHHFSDDPNLVVVDSASFLQEPAILLPWLSSLVPPGHLLVISRCELPGDLSAQVFRVPPLTLEALSALIHEQLHAQRIALSTLGGDAGVAALYESIGGNPLAARMLVHDLAKLPLNRVLGDLSNLRTPSGAFLLEVLYSDLWNSLNEDAQHLAEILSQIPREGATWSQFYQHSGGSPTRVDTALRHLIMACLVDPVDDKPLYRMQPLIRRFVIAQASPPAQTDDGVLLLDPHRAYPENVLHKCGVA